MKFSDAMTSPKLFGRWFGDESWRPWRAIHKAIDGLPLDPQELAIFHQLAGDRDPPARPVSELWGIAGRRSAKSLTAAARASFQAAVPDYRQYLAPGETAFVLYLAVDRAQARLAFNYVRGFFQEISLLQRMVVRESREEIELNNGVTIVVATNDFRRVRGRTVVCAVLEEVAFWRDETSASPDVETYNALLPSTATIPNSLIIGITSPYAKRGLAYQKYRDHFGTDSADTLVIKAASRDLNPTLPEHIVQDALERDPVAAAAEWLGEFRSDIESYVPREAVEAAVERDLFELPYVSKIRYFGFVDPSGGSRDSFTLAVAHNDDGTAVLDVVAERRPPFSPEAVVKDFAEILKRYHLATVTGDRYAGEFPRELFQKKGVTYKIAKSTRSELYLALLPQLMSGKVQLLDNKKLVAQLCNLERRTARGGRDAIDHPPGGHDDLANSAAGALWLCNKKAHRAKISEDDFVIKHDAISHAMDSSGMPLGEPFVPWDDPYHF